MAWLALVTLEQTCSCPVGQLLAQHSDDKQAISQLGAARVPPSPGDAAEAETFQDAAAELLWSNAPGLHKVMRLESMVTQGQLVNNKTALQNKRKKGEVYAAERLTGWVGGRLRRAGNAARVY